MKKIWIVGLMTLCFASIVMASTPSWRSLELTVNLGELGLAKDVWYESPSSGRVVNDSVLQVGETSRVHNWSVLKFDVNKLPWNATRVTLKLYCLPGPVGKRNSPVKYRQTAFNWRESNRRGEEWRSYGFDLGTFSPTPNNWVSIDLTTQYNSWKMDPGSNYGIFFYVYQPYNQLNVFASTNHPNPALRPALVIKYGIYDTSSYSYQFQMPLEEGLWNLTTQIGDLGCGRTRLGGEPSHTGANHFSLDFASNGEADIPILAPARGRVTFAGQNTQLPKNGNYVVIDHDFDGNPMTGITTRLLHLRSGLKVRVGQYVAAGDVLGMMGGTGGYPVHCHLGFQFRGNGGSSAEAKAVLSSVYMEWIKLNEYVIDCTQRGTAVPTQYWSSNFTEQW